MTGRGPETAPAINHDRIHDWLASGDPNHLWPDVRPPDRLAAHAAIVDATRTLLNSDTAAVPLAAPDEPTARAIGVAAFESGMGPLLGYWQKLGRLDAPPRLAAVLAKHLHHGRLRHAAMHAALLGVLDAAARRHITPVLLKGAHTGRAYFPDPATRVGTDVDLLVAPAEFAAMQSVLQQAGFREMRRSAAPFRSEWAPRTHPMDVVSLELNHADNPWSIDLHVSLDRWFVGPGRVAAGQPATAPFAVEGRPVRALQHPTLATYLAVHASNQPHEIQLVRLVELALILRHDRGHLDWDAMDAHVRSTDAARIAYPALALVGHLFPGTVPPAIADTLYRAASPSARRVTAALRESGTLRLPKRMIAEKFMWARGPVERARALREAVWPADDGNSLRARLRILVRRARMLASGRAGLGARQRATPQS